MEIREDVLWTFRKTRDPSRLAGIVPDTSGDDRPSVQTNEITLQANHGAFMLISARPCALHYKKKRPGRF